MTHKIIIAIVLLLGIPAGLLLYCDALMLRSNPASLRVYDFWVCLGGALVILLLEALGLRSLLRGQFRRKRKLKVAALSITVFVFLAWQASVVFQLAHGWASGPWAFLSNGCLEAGIDRSGRATSWTRFVVLPADPPSLYWDKIHWRPSIWWSRTGRLKAIRVPLWAVYVAILIPTIYLFWRYRRLPSGFCQVCSYNLTGNVSGVCPECGETIDLAEPSSVDH